MQKKKIYRQIKFGARALRKAVDACAKLSSNNHSSASLSVTIGDEEWHFDSLDEFFSEHSRNEVHQSYLYLEWHSPGESSILFHAGTYPFATEIRVTAGTRADIEAVFAVFEEAPAEDKIKLEAEHDQPAVFIGHGRHREWEKLKAHLQDKHDIKVVAYETGARAGHSIRDILSTMSNQSSFALLVLTGEDKTEDGIRARQNVIHECGLFQGTLGFDRAIMLVEKGIDLGSNFDGIQQLRFTKGRISEVFGDVLATLRREFGPL